MSENAKLPEVGEDDDLSPEAPYRAVRREIDEAWYGPDGWLMSLSVCDAPEDIRWYRNLKPVLDRLNEQAKALDAARAEGERYRKALEKTEPAGDLLMRALEVTGRSGYAAGLSQEISDFLVVWDNARDALKAPPDAARAALSPGKEESK